MSISSQTHFVSNYLTNFFADATVDEIALEIRKIDPSILNVMRTLIEHDMSIKEIVDTTSHRIENLESSINLKEKQIKILEKKLAQMSSPKTQSQPIPEIRLDLSKLEKLKLIRSATYNARLYLIFREICMRYVETSQPVSLRRVHREMGLTRIINAFNPSPRSSKDSILTGLIGDLFLFNKIGRELTAIPTRLGLEIFNLGEEYYSKENTEVRFNSMKLNGELTATKLNLFETIYSSSEPIRNTDGSKQILARKCSIHVDNISKYLVELVKLGFLERIPAELNNKKLIYRCYNS